MIRLIDWNNSQKVIITFSRKRFNFHDDTKIRTIDMLISFKKFLEYQPYLICDSDDVYIRRLFPDKSILKT